MLETYFLYLSNFSHDRARETVTPAPLSLPGPLLAQLAMAERQYMALAFLQPRTSVFQVRKDPPLRTVYQSLGVELESLASGLGTQQTVWAHHAHNIVVVRGRMIDVYERLSNCPSTEAPPYTEVVHSLDTVVELVGSVLGGLGEDTAIAPWVNVVRCETQALRDL